MYLVFVVQKLYIVEALAKAWEALAKAWEAVRRRGKHLRWSGSSAMARGAEVANVQHFAWQEQCSIGRVIRFAFVQTQTDAHLNEKADRKGQLQNARKA